MPKARYNLHTHAYGTTIRLVLRYNSTKFVYYTGISVIASDWNKARQELRKGAPLWQERNAALLRLRNEADRLYTESLGGELINNKILKFKLDAFWKHKNYQIDTDTTVCAFIREYTAQRLKAGEIAPNTAKSFNTLAGQIELFDRSVTFDEITLEWYGRFSASMRKANKAHNTITTRTKRLKAIMRAAIDAGLTANRAFESSRFTIKEIQVDNIYLTESEVQTFETLVLDGQLALYRDLFLLGVYTGMRYSDFSTLAPGDYHTHDGIFMVKKRAKKTKAEIAVPINEKARAILVRYGMKPPGTTNQKFNQGLKKIAQLAGLNDLVKIQETKGGVERVSMRPKWSLVTSHTGRRTFATLSYLRLAAAGLPIDGIMDITGHKTRREFLKYIKVGAVERAALWAKAGG